MVPSFLPLQKQYSENNFLLDSYDECLSTPIWIEEENYMDYCDAGRSIHSGALDSLDNNIILLSKRYFKQMK